MSMNPYHLELMAKVRQEELLALARPRQVALPRAGRRSLGARIRGGLARLMIWMGRRLAPSGSDRGCPYQRREGAGLAADPLWRCDCPGRRVGSDCPPLASG
jgi:hypothetical protein